MGVVGIMVDMRHDDMTMLRKKFGKVKDIVEEGSVAPDEVLTLSEAEVKEDQLADQVALLKYKKRKIERVLNKFRGARSASDVFADNALDAAKVTVLEMHLASSSTDRQRAAESVLNRALGKPVDRVMSIGMQVSSKSEGELEHDIRRLLDELGYAGGEGKTREIIAGGKGILGIDKVEEVRSESGVEWREGVPRKVYTIDGES